MTIQGFEPGAHLRLQVLPNRLRVPFVELGLEPLNLLDAKLVNFGVYRHVLFLGEHHFVVTCGEVCFERD